MLKGPGFKYLNQPRVGIKARTCQLLRLVMMAEVLTSHAFTQDIGDNEAEQLRNTRVLLIEVRQTGDLGQIGCAYLGLERVDCGENGAEHTQTKSQEYCPESPHRESGVIFRRDNLRNGVSWFNEDTMS